MLREIKGLSKGVKDFEPIFALHLYTPDHQVLADIVDKYNALLNSAGFYNPTIYITDLGSKNVIVNEKLKAKKDDKKLRSPREEAYDMLKLHIVAFAHGVDKLFWEKLIDFDRGRLRAVGLFGKEEIQHNGKKKMFRKTTYFTYKLMTRKLANCEWDRVSIIHEGENGIYLYKFVNTKNGKSKYIAWVEET